MNMFSVSPSQNVFEPELELIDNTGGVITVIVTVDDTGEVEEQLELASDTRYSLHYLSCKKNHFDHSKLPMGSRHRLFSPTQNKNFEGHFERYIKSDI